MCGIGAPEGYRPNAELSGHINREAIDWSA